MMRLLNEKFCTFNKMSDKMSAFSRLELNVHVNVKQTFMKLFIFRECLLNAAAL